MFSLLRGSGLKWYVHVRYCTWWLFSLLRGSGLKFYKKTDLEKTIAFSLLRGSGLKWAALRVNNYLRAVLPLTREWIEICPLLLTLQIYLLFSLLRGSGLKSVIYIPVPQLRSSPSYEGVDWNFVKIGAKGISDSSPSYEGVDWNSKVLCNS